MTGPVKPIGGPPKRLPGASDDAEPPSEALGSSRSAIVSAVTIGMQRTQAEPASRGSSVGSIWLAVTKSIRTLIEEDGVIAEADGICIDADNSVDINRTAQINDGVVPQPPHAHAVVRAPRNGPADAKHPSKPKPAPWAQVHRPRSPYPATWGWTLDPVEPLSPAANLNRLGDDTGGTVLRILGWGVALFALVVVAATVMAALLDHVGTF